MKLSKSKIISTTNRKLFNTEGYPLQVQELTSLFQECTTIVQLNQIHGHMITAGLIHRPPLASKLIACFASNPSPGAASAAHTIAGNVEGLDAFTWNTVMRGYVDRSDPKSAISVYSHLRMKGVILDSYSLLFAIKACSLMPPISLGKQIHTDVLKFGFVSEGVLQTALINMYRNFDELHSARQLFDEMSQRDIISWNCLLVAYLQSDCPSQALEASRAMANDGVVLNKVTAVTLLSCCALLKLLREGKSVHGRLIRHISNPDVFVNNALIDMYSKCRWLPTATRIFNSMPEKTVVSWTSMLNGYSENNRLTEALAMFREMESANVRPDEVILLSVISICSKSGRTELIDWIDFWVCKNFSGKRSIKLSNALIAMHAKFGNIQKSIEIFNGMKDRTLVSWTSLIHGLAMHGHGVSALVKFTQMLREGFEPDNVVFLSILSACSHSGLVEEGRGWFDSMRNDFGIEPLLEHYGCMVDLLCRAGVIDEAFEFVVNMPIEADDMLWRMLLRACHDRGESRLGKEVVKRMHQSGLESCENLMAVSNFGASVVEWDMVRDVREEMKAKGAMNHQPGFSFVEVINIQ